MSFDLKLANGDLKIDQNGGLEKVYNEEKLTQDLLKIVLTPQGTNPLYPWYGSPLNERTIGTLLDPKILNFEMVNAIQLAIRNLMELQKAQERDGQYISPSEAIGQILDIDILRSPYDARAYYLKIKVAARRGNVVEESFSVTI